MLSHPYVRAVLSGVLFALWPILMNRSGLSGNLASLVFILGNLAIVAPFALMSNGLAIPHADWLMAGLSCAVASIALLFLNSVLAKATPAAAGTIILLMVLPQVVVPAVYQAFMTHSMPAAKIVGVVLAIIAAVLLA